jgi:hypothetical protein
LTRVKKSGNVGNTPPEDSPRVQDRSAIGRRAKARGAAQERAALEPLAKRFGEPFKRTGNRGTSSADVTSEHYCVEIKSRLRPTWSELRNAWKQAEKAAEETGLEPYVLFAFTEDGKKIRWLIQKLEERD